MYPKLLEGLGAFLSGIANTDVRSTFSYARFRGLQTVSDAPAISAPSDHVRPPPTANVMPLQANDATAATSPSHDLPPNPFAGVSSPAHKQSSASIDLTSPTGSLKRPHDQERIVDPVRPSVRKKRKSDDELRLVGDYSQPADAVSLPAIPGFKHKGAMAPKPGAHRSFQPMNTLGGNPTPSRTKRTYSKTSTSRPLSIGLGPHDGQRAYTELQRNRLQESPAKLASIRDRHTQPSGGVGRRRTEEVIDISGNDEDEVQEVSPATVFSPVGMFHDGPRSARSSQSRQSVRSEGTRTEFKTSQSTSEFQEADRLLRPNLKKPRNQPPNKTQGARVQSPFASGTLSARPVNNIRRTSDTHRAILQDIQQGIHEYGNQRPRSNGTVASHHFPEPRINVSTGMNTSNNRPVTDLDSDLRHHHRPVPRRADLVDNSYSEDELASAAPTTARKRTTSPSKANQTTKGGAKQKNRSPQSKTPSKRWPLLFARTYGYQGRSSKLDDGRTELSLRTDPDGWRVTTCDLVEGTWLSHVTITSQDFVKAQTDKIGSIRLEGSRGHGGNSSVFDLQFANTSDLLAFCNNVASLTTKGHCYVKSESIMSLLFSKPLAPKNDKIGTTELVHEPKSETVNLDDKNSNTSRKTLLAGLNGQNGSPSLSTPARTSTRPVRSTRSAPIYETVEPLESTRVEKYSIDKGLGTPWTKPLEYGKGRQRAVVYFDDLPKLDEEEYLNDDLINFYMTYLFTTLKVPFDKVYFFNTHFYTKLTEKAGRNSINYQAVARWTSKVDIYSYDYIVVPINENFHWYLAIICNVSNIDGNPVLGDNDVNPAQALDESRKESAGMDATKVEDVESPQQVSSPKLPASTPGETLDEPNEDNTNLFEESILLVDRDDMGMGSQPHTKPDQGSLEAHLPMAEPVEVEKIAADAKASAEGILSQPSASSAKSKAKRKLPQPRKDPNKPIILILDSLGQPHSAASRALKDWLTAEGKARRDIDTSIKDKAYYPKGTQIPTQDNFTDCGVYLLGYVEKFFHDPDGFKNELLTGAMSSEDDWPELKPKEMRDKMRSIILRCHKEQEGNRKAEKKIRKGVTPVKTPSRPASGEPTKADSDAPLTARSPSKEAKVLKTNPGNTQNELLSSTQPLGETAGPKLASPISFSQRRTKSPTHSSPTVVGKVSDSPPVATSPSRPPSITPQINQTPRRFSPEVRISVKSPQTSVPMRAGHDIPVGDSPSNDDRHYESKISSSTPKKRSRQDEGDDQLASPAAKRQSTRSPQQQRANHGTNHPTRGSSSNEPIEIGDSQDGTSMASQNIQHPQENSVAQRQPPSRSKRPKHTMYPLSSSEQVRSSSPRAAEKRGQQQSEESFLGRKLEASLEQDDMVGSEARQEKARSPHIAVLQPQPALRRTPESVDDPMDLDPQSTDPMDILKPDPYSNGAMEIDVTNDAVIRETPELESRSPTSQMVV